jgi:hypothetical protein
MNAVRTGDDRRSASSSAKTLCFQQHYVASENSIKKNRVFAKTSRRHLGDGCAHAMLSGFGITERGSDMRNRRILLMAGFVFAGCLIASVSHAAVKATIFATGLIRLRS